MQQNGKGHLSNKLHLSHSKLAERKIDFSNAKMAEEQQSLPSLKLNIKSTKRKDTVEVPTDCTVKQVSILSEL